MYINNKKAAQVAAAIAAKYGFEIAPEAFLKRYTNNVLTEKSFFAPNTAARVAAERAIVAALKRR